MKKPRMGPLEKNRTVTNSSFTTCPICHASILLYKAEEHVATCLMKKDSLTETTESTHAHGLKRKQLTEVAEDKKRVEKHLVEEKSNQLDVSSKAQSLQGSSCVLHAELEAMTDQFYQGMVTKPADSTQVQGLFQNTSSSWQIKLKDGTLCMARPHKDLGGQWLFEDFVSEQEESELIHLIDRSTPIWQVRSSPKSNGHHMVKAWGVRPDYLLNTVSPAVHPMPPWLLNLAERMRGGLPLMSRFSPNEANAVKYVKEQGHWLKAHADHRSMSSELIVNLSLGGAATMTFGSTRNGNQHRVLLPRRSLQVMSGDARYGHTHAINLGDFHDPLRVSITFRYSPITHP